MNSSDPRDLLLMFVAVFLPRILFVAVFLPRILFVAGIIILTLTLYGGLFQ